MRDPFWSRDYAFGFRGADCRERYTLLLTICKKHFTSWALTALRVVTCFTTSPSPRKRCNLRCAPNAAESNVHTIRMHNTMRKQDSVHWEAISYWLSLAISLFLNRLCIFTATLITDYRIGNTIYSLVSASTGWSITIRVARAAKTMLLRYTVVLVINVCPRRACQFPTLNGNRLFL